MYVAESAAGPGDWAHYGLDSNETRDSSLTQINSNNVSQLGLAWSVELSNEAGVLEGTPLEVGGVLYVNGGVGAVYAFEASTGRPLWTYEPRAHEADPRGTRRHYPSDKGLAYWKGKIYTCTLDGRMVAVDAKNGSVLWSTQFIVPGTNTLSTGAPRSMDGRIIIGTSGSDQGARGYVTAVDADTGKIAWRFFTVPGNPAKGFEDSAQEKAATTWSGEWWKYGGGGAVWNAITYDRELGRVYLGTGNANPYLDEVRGGPAKDNLFTASIVALDAKTGRYIWHYQTTPDDVWDFDAASDMILATVRFDGADRKVLLQANKNGFFYIVDRVGGQVLAADQFAPVSWATRVDLKTGRPVEVPGSRYRNSRTVVAPGVVGAHSWQPMSYNLGLGLIYIPVLRAVSVFTPSAKARARLEQSAGRIPSAQGVGGVLRPESRDGVSGAGRDELIAWDPIARKVRWRVRQSSQFNGGTLTTDGNLVFQGTTEGHLIAYSADEGRQLWSYYAHMGILAPPITYSVGGKQYISVLAGYGGGPGESASIGYGGWAWGMPRRLLTFRLGGTAQLPSAPHPMTHVRPLDDTALKLDPARIEAGGTLYGEVCGACHGEAVVANGNAPDLRASAVAFNREAFQRLLSQGLLVPKGMPQFDDLSQSEMEAIYEYIRSRAREDLKTGRDGVDAVLGPEAR